MVWEMHSLLKVLADNFDSAEDLNQRIDWIFDVLNPLFRILNPHSSDRNPEP